MRLDRTLVRRGPAGVMGRLFYPELPADRPLETEILRDVRRQWMVLLQCHENGVIACRAMLDKLDQLIEEAANDDLG